jgi:predicted transcriptional regulator
MALHGKRTDLQLEILRYVAHHPGAHFREVQRALGLGTGQADHHLRRLTREGLVARTPLAGEVHFFAAKVPRIERPALAALQHPARAALARSLAESGPASLTALAARLGCPPSTAAHHLRVLSAAGVTRRVGTRPHAVFELASLVARDAVALRPARAQETELVHG